MAISPPGTIAGAAANARPEPPPSFVRSRSYAADDLSVGTPPPPPPGPPPTRRAKSAGRPRRQDRSPRYHHPPIKSAPSVDETVNSSLPSTLGSSSSHSSSRHTRSAMELFEERRRSALAIYSRESLVDVELAHQSSKESVSSLDQSFDRSLNQSRDQSFDLGRSRDQSFYRSLNQSRDQSFDRSYGHTRDQSFDRSVDRSLDRYSPGQKRRTRTLESSSPRSYQEAPSQMVESSPRRYQEASPRRKPTITVDTSLTNGTPSSPGATPTHSNQKVKSPSPKTPSKRELVIEASPRTPSSRGRSMARRTPSRGRSTSRGPPSKDRSISRGPSKAQSTAYDKIITTPAETPMKVKKSQKKRLKSAADSSKSIASSKSSEKKGFFKKLLKRGKQQDKQEVQDDSKSKSGQKGRNSSIARPKNLKPGQSYKSTPNSAEIVVRGRSPSLNQQTKGHEREREAPTSTTRVMVQQQVLKPKTADPPSGNFIANDSPRERIDAPEAIEPPVEPPMDSLEPPVEPPMDAPVSVEPPTDEAASEVIESTSAEEAAELDIPESFSSPRFQDADEIESAEPTSTGSDETSADSFKDSENIWGRDDISAITDPTFLFKSKSSMSRNSPSRSRESEDFQATRDPDGILADGSNQPSKPVAKDPDAFKAIDPFMDPFFNSENEERATFLSSRFSPKFDRKLTGEDEEPQFDDPEPQLDDIQSEEEEEPQFDDPEPQDEDELSEVEEESIFEDIEQAVSEESELLDSNAEEGMLGIVRHPHAQHFFADDDDDENVGSREISALDFPHFHKVKGAPPRTESPSPRRSPSPKVKKNLQAAQSPHHSRLSQKALENRYMRRAPSPHLTPGESKYTAKTSKESPSLRRSPPPSPEENKKLEVAKSPHSRLSQKALENRYKRGTPSPRVTSDDSKSGVTARHRPSEEYESNAKTSRPQNFTEKKDLKSPPSARSANRPSKVNIEVEKAGGRNSSDAAPMRLPHSRMGQKALASIRVNRAPKISIETEKVAGGSPSDLFEAEQVRSPQSRLSQKAIANRRKLKESPSHAHSRTKESPKTDDNYIESPRPYFATKFEGRKPSSSPRRPSSHVGPIGPRRKPLTSPGRGSIRLKVTTTPESPSQRIGSRSPTVFSPGKSPVATGLTLKSQMREELILAGKATVSEPKKQVVEVESVETPVEEPKDPIQRAGRRLLSKSAIVIQAHIRRHLAKNAVVDRVWAILSVQSYFRRWKYEALLMAHRHSATKIQSAFRGWLARDKLADQDFCATEIQKVVRGYFGATWAYDRFYRIILLQALARVWLARREAGKRRIRKMQLHAERMNKSAVLVQSIWRMYASRLHYQFDIVDIILAQSLVRRKIAMKRAEKKRDMIIEKSAIKIQSAWRGFKCYKNTSIDIVDIIIVQCVFRRRMAIMCVEAKRDALMNKSAIRIQSAWRGFKSYTDFIFAFADVMIVQRTARKWLAVRKANRRRLFVSATKIQSNWRRYRAQMAMLYSLVHIIMVQTIVRRHFACKRSKHLRLENAQSQRYYLIKSDAATKIQTAWRGFWQYSHYIIMHYEIVRLQAAFRGYRARGDYALKIGCVIILQSVARVYLARRKAKEMRLTKVMVASAALGMRFDHASRCIQSARRAIAYRQKEKAAARIIVRFFKMVKAEVDREIQRVQRKKKSKRSRRKKKEKDASLLERAWLNTVDDSKVDRFGDPRSETYRRSKSAPRPRNTASRRVVPPADTVRVHRDVDMLSDVTSSSIQQNRSSSRVRSRQATLSLQDLNDDLSLEEAWIDTEVVQAKDRRRADEVYLQRHGLQPSVHHSIRHREDAERSGRNRHVLSTPRASNHFTPKSPVPNRTPRGAYNPPTPRSDPRYSNGQSYHHESSPRDSNNQDYMGPTPRHGNHQVLPGEEQEGYFFDESATPTRHYAERSDFRRGYETPRSVPRHGRY